MSCAIRLKLECRRSGISALTVVGMGLFLGAAGRLDAQNGTGSAGPLAQSCGVPAAGANGQSRGGRGLPVFPAGTFPVKLPPASVLGAAVARR